MDNAPVILSIFQGILRDEEDYWKPPSLECAHEEIFNREVNAEYNTFAV